MWEVPSDSSRDSHDCGKGRGQHRADTELMPRAAVEGRVAAKELGEHRQGGGMLGMPVVQNPASPVSMDQEPPQREGSGIARALAAHGESPQCFRGSTLTTAGI